MNHSLLLLQLASAIGFLSFFVSLPNVFAQTGTLAEPFPAPSPNAALHYQRALLQMEQSSPDHRDILTQPIWETRGKAQASNLGRLLLRSRFAVGSATTGTRLAECNFGINFSQLGAAAQLPHVDGMVQLGRLLTLRGLESESRGEWEEALIIYFDGLRMGRHLTHQNTLLEALAGIAILRNNYYALAMWSAHCPERLLVARGFGLLESIESSLVNAPQIIAKEASILALDFERLRSAYPSGNWAAIVLESYGQPVSGDSTKDRELAIAACIRRGVPKQVFESSEAFDNYLGKLQRTSNRFVESVSACMALDPKARMKRAAALNKKYSLVIPVLSSDTLIDPIEIGALFAHHEAELTLTRIAMAVGASKSDGKFPDSLTEVANRFGGTSPEDPYSAAKVVYVTHDSQTAYSLRIPGVGPLPDASFESRPPEPAK